MVVASSGGIYGSKVIFNPLIISAHWNDAYIFVLWILIKSSSPQKILLALRSIIKTSQNAAKESSIRIFVKALETFQSSNDKNIDVITKGEGFNNH